MKKINETGLFVRIALLSTLLIGGVIGLTSLIAPFTGWDIDQTHRLQHMHLQIWYFIGGFVLGAGFRIVPQLSGSGLPNSWGPPLAGLLYTVSGLLWIFAMPLLYPNPGDFHAVLTVGVLLESIVWSVFCGFLLYSICTSERSGVWQPVTCVALVVLLLSSAASAVGWSGITTQGSFDMEGVRMGYRGFLFVGVPLLAMGISGRALRKKEDPDAPYLIGVFLIAFSMVSFAQLFQASWIQTAGLYTFLPGFALFAYGISFHRQYDRLNIPGFYHGVVVAFSFVLIFAVLYLLNWLLVVNVLYRGLIHVWALGFLTVLIVAYGTWIFPSAAGRTPINSPSSLVAIYLLAAGTLLRVFAPVIVTQTGATGPVFNQLLLAGGLLQYTGIAVFAVVLWPNLPSFYS